MNPKFKLPVLIAVIVLLILTVGYFLLFQKKNGQAPAPQKDASAIVPETPDVGSKIGELSNPLGDKLSDLNPVEKTNPFKDVKTNPFR